MAKQDVQQNVEDLPTLDDFSESSLLDVINEEEEEETQETGEEETSKETSEEKKKPDNPLEKKIPEKKKSKSKSKKEEEEEESEEEEEDIEEGSEEETEDEKEEDETEESEEEESEGNFWSDVEQITGVPVKVDYGDIDPESPEGAALREKALVEQVEQNIWGYIEQKYPKSYKALTVEANGGDLSELITPDYVDYDKITIEEDNVAQQKKILLDYYMEVKKLPEARAQRMIEMDEDSDDEQGLFKAAKDALEERKTDQKAREDAIAEKNEKEAKKRQNEDKQMLGYIKSVTDKGEIGNFQLAQADKEKFFEFFASQVTRNPEGGYMFSSAISNDNFNDLLEQAYFSFKGGKLDKLVQRRQQTEKTRKLKRKAKAEKTKSPSTTTEKKRERDKELPTFDSYQED